MTLNGFFLQTKSRFITVCHMWSCRQADGEEEAEELILSTEEKEVSTLI